MAKKKRQFYIDNLRILLTCLVVLHHLAITYGGPGLWYYNEGNSNLIASVLLSLFVATNQAFFMGMFFMISAYFLDKSWKRKPSNILLKNKLKRLGIPLMFYILIISPIIIYLTVRYDKGIIVSVSDFLLTGNWISFGPLWFVAALLIFSLIAIFLKSKLIPVNSNNTDISVPTNSKIILAAVLIGIVSFIVRIWLPVGWVLKPFSFQFAHFPQYIILFYVGIIASQNNWFSKITYHQGIKWFRAVLFMVLVLFPLVFYFGGAIEKGTTSFTGGMTWQSFLYCLWEQMVGIGIMVGLIGIFKEKYNEQGNRLKSASASAYTVYIIHALILVCISLLIKDIEISSTFKFLILAPIVLIVCFSISSFIRRLPYIREVL